MDDGFWEGELNGRIGVFPSLVVELVHDEGEEEEEEVRLCTAWFLGLFPPRAPHLCPFTNMLGR